MSNNQEQSNQEPSFYVNGTDYPPSTAIEGSIFRDTVGTYFRFSGGKWVKLGE